MAKEYRWENERIGHGHFYTNLIQCLKDAHNASIRFWPEDVIRVEQIEPERLILITIKGGVEKIIQEVGI